MKQAVLVLFPGARRAVLTKLADLKAIAKELGWPTYHAIVSWDIGAQSYETVLTLDASKTEYSRGAGISWHRDKAVFGSNAGSGQRDTTEPKTS
jgi:hypothetical protein